MKRFLSSLAALSLLMAGSLASAGTVSVYVGYADNLRPNPFFPNPWNGSPNTIFQGSTTPGTTFDAGAILIQNNSGGPINVNDVFVSGFDNGATFDLWGTPGMLPDNTYMILTQTNTNSSQFDSSDDLIGFSYPDSGPNGSPGGSGFTPSHPYTGDPQVKITINGVATTFADTGHVLDTGGYDTATWPDRAAVLYSQQRVAPVATNRDDWSRKSRWRPPDARACHVDDDRFGSYFDRGVPLAPANSEATGLPRRSMRTARCGRTTGIRAGSFPTANGGARRRSG